MKYPQEMAVARSFMNSLTKGFTNQKRAFILVQHINPTSMPLIETLGRSGRIAGIIAKPNSIDFRTYERLSDKYKFLDLDKHRLLEPNVFDRYIAPLVSENEKLIIIDIGGYFSGTLEELNRFVNLGGIVEDTENGLQKYEKALKGYPYNEIPIFSVARSRSKDFEDYLVGRSVAYSTVRILKKEKLENWKNRKVGVIGFGEVGRGAAFYLKDNLGMDVSVYDCNPDVQQKIKLSGFNAVSRKEILKNSEIIIGATGNGSLCDKDICELKKGCYISSCTSGDDEFAFEKVDFEKGVISSHNTVKIDGVNFINKGNAVNFIYPDQMERLLSPYIYLTHSALLEGAVLLDRKEALKTNEINILSKNQEKLLIANFRNMLKNKNKNSVFVDRFLLSGLGRE